MSSLFSTENIVFVLMSFEGPDKYSLVGGLGTRIMELARVISEENYKVHTFFVGDPYLPENTTIGNITYHRKCKNISSESSGIYDREKEKIEEWNKIVPQEIIDEIVIPNAQKGILTAILAEDWQMSESVIILDKLLHQKNLRDYCVIYWNVNNEYGLNGVDIKKLSEICTITTVSKFMKKRMKDIYSVESIPIPNGIPQRIIGEPDLTTQETIKNCFDGIILQKVARYDSDKNWICAVETISLLKEQGLKPHFLMRGGAQPYRTEVIYKILELGLKYVTVNIKNPTLSSIISTFKKYSHFDIIEMDFFIPEEFLMLLYGTADLVFANSTYEPFGIVGLEVMAKRGLPILGCTGEDYAINNKNSIRTNSENPTELKNAICDILQNYQLREEIRNTGLETAKQFTWNRALSILIHNIEVTVNDFNLKKIGLQNIQNGQILLKPLKI